MGTAHVSVWPLSRDLRGREGGQQTGLETDSPCSQRLCPWTPLGTLSPRPSDQLCPHIGLLKKEAHMSALKITTLHQSTTLCHWAWPSQRNNGVSPRPARREHRINKQHVKYYNNNGRTDGRAVRWQTDSQRAASCHVQHDQLIVAQRSDCIISHVSSLRWNTRISRVAQYTEYSPTSTAMNYRIEQNGKGSKDCKNCIYCSVNFQRLTEMWVLAVVSRYHLTNARGQDPNPQKKNYFQKFVSFCVFGYD